MQEVPGTNNPFWDECITFDILRGVENLQVQVQDVQANREWQVIGEVEIDLKELSNNHFRWIDEMNEKYDGKYN